MIFLKKSRVLRMLCSAIVLSCFLISSSAPISASNQTAMAQAEKVFVEDFSDRSEGKDMFSFGYVPGDGLAMDEYKNFSWQHDMDQALLLNSNKSITWDDKFYYYPSSSVTKQGENCFSLTEFDIYTEKTYTSSPHYDIYLTSTQSSGRFFAVIRVAGGAISVAGNEKEDGKTLNLSEPVYVTEGEWHHVRVLMRCTDENAKACAVLSSVSVDGEIIYTSTEERTLASYKSKLKHYDMLCVQNRQNAPGGYIDNITVQRLTSYTGSGLPADKGELLYRVRQTADFLHQYSFLEETSSYQKLKQEYEDAISLLENGGTEYDYRGKADALETMYQSMFAKEQGVQVKEIHYGIDGAMTGITVDNPEESQQGMVIVGTYQGKRLTGSGLVCDVTIAKGLSTITFEEPVVVQADAETTRLFLWNEALQAISESIDVSNTALFDNLDIRVDGKLYFTDAPARVMADGTVYVPAENLLNLLGASMEKKNQDTYHAERIDGTFMEFTIGSEKSNTTNGVIKGAAPYRHEEILPMVAMASLCEAFSCTYTIDWETNTLLVTSNYTEDLGEVRSPYLVELNCFNIGYGSFCFKIITSSRAKVEVFTRVDQTQVEGILSIDEANGETKETYGGWSMPNESVVLWKKAYDVTYQNGGWIGSFSGIRPNGKYYDIMYRITKDGETETVLKKRAVTLPSCYPELDTVVYEATELKLVPTFENLSYYFASPEVSSAEVYYKKSAESIWNKGYTPTYDARIGQYLGSITGLTPNTSYDVKLVLDGVEETGQIQTWNEEPVVREIPLSEIYDGGTLVLQGLKGTEEEWIKIIGDETTVVDGGENNWESIYISDCENLILENITVVGGKRYGISVSGGSKNIRISNCDISHWGRLGVWSDSSHKYRLHMGTVNYDSGIVLVDADNVVIERCYIHDCNARTNPWHGADYTQVHPAGGSAIYTQMGSGLVVRYNDFIGNSVHRWNDAIEGAFNSSYHAGVGFDADIYGNMFFGGNDDGIELDGGSMNVRVYQNRIEQVYNGISFAPIKIGPVYVFGNLIYNLGDRETNAASSTKQGTVLDEGNGKQFWFNNTFLARKNARVLNTTAYNNLIASDTSIYPIAQSRLGDYNFLFGKTSSFSYQEHELYGLLPGFKDFSCGNFGLAADSVAKGAGTWIDNFMEKENPDIGVSAYAESLPVRSAALSADKYHLRMQDQATATVTIQTGKLEEGLSFSVEKSNADTWFEIMGDVQDSVQSDTEYHITVKTNMDALVKEAKIQNDDLSGLMLFRLSNGFSIPITVHCHR